MGELVGAADVWVGGPAECVYMCECVKDEVCRQYVILTIVCVT